MRIEPLTDDGIASAYAVHRAAAEWDVPDIPPLAWSLFDNALRHPLPSTRLERFVATRDGVVVGFALLNLPQYDNLDNAHIDLVVAPDQRRQGIGRALHAVAVERARAAGRKHLTGGTFDIRRHGDAFAAAMGAVAALRETRSRLDVGRADPDALEALRTGAWGHADGYRLAQWIGVPPDELVDDIAYLDSRLNLDAPRGELALEAEKVDADRVRANERARQARGLTAFHTGAVHAASGRLVAWTTLTSTAEAPWHAWQQITIVDPEHRGHRLGLVVKLENLRYLRAHRPELSAIDTVNASANEHMLDVNRLMGFRPVGVETQWQQTL
ncbi:GNAT family N-acetyltransferase [Krasilnikovia sp. MM14-A1004]|uniref:GNAT family N-acetyltransferase n=1 Tax=Krasilnikovia sp. MM14-A1004 TaxID=3373541 RepID=UPI00399D4F5E